MAQFKKVRKFWPVLVAILASASGVHAKAKSVYHGKLKRYESGVVLVINPGKLNEESLPLLGLSADQTIEFNNVLVEVEGEIIHLKGRAIALKVSSIK